MKVAEIWDNIERYYDPRKIERQKLFYRVFENVVRDLSKGMEYTPALAEMTEYWDYLKGYHESWRADPITPRAYGQLKHKFFSAVRLFNSIKNEGLRDPLEMGRYHGKTFLHRGQRRIVILHVLGVEDAPVNYN